MIWDVEFGGEGGFQECASQRAMTCHKPRHYQGMCGSSRVAAEHQVPPHRNQKDGWDDGCAETRSPTSVDQALNVRQFGASPFPVRLISYGKTPYNEHCP